MKQATLMLVLVAVLLLAHGQGVKAETVHTLGGNVYLTYANGEGTFQGGTITFQPHGYTTTVGQSGLFSVYDVAVDVYTATLSFGGIEFVKGGLTADRVHVFGFYDDSLCNELEPTQPVRHVYLPMVTR